MFICNFDPLEISMTEIGILNIPTENIQKFPLKTKYNDKTIFFELFLKSNILGEDRFFASVRKSEKPVYSKIQYCLSVVKNIFVAFAGECS